MHLNIATRTYLLYLVAIDDGENAPAGVDVAALIDVLSSNDDDQTPALVAAHVGRLMERIDELDTEVKGFSSLV